MQSILLPQILKQSIRANRAKNVLYLNNPKAGCSTIKRTLWCAIRDCPPNEITNVHRIEGSPFSDRIEGPGWVTNAVVFTFVRNPYTRIVSAYLNKIVSRRDLVWQNFAKRHDISDRKDFGFDDFIAVLSENHPERFDRHWRPQTLNTLYPFVKPNFVGQLESLDEQLSIVLAKVFPGRKTTIQSGQRHATGASDEFASYFADSGTRARFLKIYEEDFAAFAYPVNYSDGIKSPRVPVFEEHDHVGLETLAQY